MKRVFYSTAFLAVALSGCATIQLSHPQKTPAIVHHVQCELKKAFKDLLPLREKLAKFRSFVIEGVPL